jgi:hypothetical protein
MNIPSQIYAYIAGQTEPRRSDMQELHRVILDMAPAARLWFLDGRDSAGKVVSNPNIGYGQYTIHYADGQSRAFYQIGMSANTTGVSVYVMGLDDKSYLARTFGKTIGKASVTGYCIKFKSLKEIDLAVLKAAMRHGFGEENA